MASDLKLCTVQWCWSPVPAMFLESSPSVHWENPTAMCSTLGGMQLLLLVLVPLGHPQRTTGRPETLSTSTTHAEIKRSGERLDNRNPSLSTLNSRVNRIHRFILTRRVLLRVLTTNLARKACSWHPWVLSSPQTPWTRFGRVLRTHPGGLRVLPAGATFLASNGGEEKAERGTHQSLLKLQKSIEP